MIRKITSSSKVFTVWAVFISVWQIYTMYFSSLPGPVPVSVEIYGIVQTNIFYVSVLSTFTRSVLGVIAVVFLGSLLMLLSYKSKTVYLFKNELVFRLTYSTPLLVWSILIVIILGFGDVSTITIVVLGILPYFLINMDESFQNLDTKKLEMGKVFLERGLMYRVVFFKEIVYPQIKPYYKSAVKTITSLCFRMTVFAEFFAASDGLGYQMQAARHVNDTTAVFGWAVLIVVLVMISDSMLNRDRKSRI